MKPAVLELDGGGLAYRVAGDGPLVVLDHALGPLAWGDVGRLAQSCTVVVVDQEASTLDRKTSMSLDWFEPLTRELGHERCALCAWSMSGPGAIWFAAEEPPLLSHLILVDIAGLTDLPPLRLRDLPHFLLTSWLGRPTRGFVRILWRNWVRSKAIDTRELEEATLRFFRANPDAFGLPGGEGGDDEEDDDDDEPLIEELRHITVPSLVLAGRHSTVLGPGPGKRAVKRLTHGELVVFEESSHSLQLEEPEKFQTVVAEFVCRP